MENTQEVHEHSSSCSIDTSGYNKIYINGEWLKGSSKKSITSEDPYTRQTLCEIPGTSVEDVNKAYESAKRAQKEWIALPPQERRNVFFKVTEILKKRKEEIIELLIRETGSTRAKAMVEWNLVHEGTLEASTYPLRIKGELIPTSIPGKNGYILRRPVGVVGVISPWDFSLQLTNRSVAPALACGNAVVLKPASSTPITGGFLFAEIYEEAGLPAGVLNVVVGDSSEIGDAFVENPIPKVITFTGSTKVGRRIGELCGKNLKKASLELGGNSPFVVLEDANLEEAVKAAIFGKFLNAGQICMAINRIIVVDKVYDDFVSRFVAAAKELKWGDPMDDENQMGPIIDQKQFDHIKKLIEDTRRAGAKVLFEGHDDGLVMHPVIMSEVTNDMPAAANEIFGPLAVLIRAKDADHALKIANDTNYGLSSSVFTQDIHRGFKFIESVEAGMGHVNDMTINDEANSPFGGEKDSGVGRFGGEWAMREFTTEHWITVQNSPREYPL